MAKEKSVWKTLSCIDVGGHAEEKNGFTYLSWAWAWQVLKDNYPDASYKKHHFMNGDHTLPFMIDHSNGSAYVMVTVTAGGESATEVFPVLDYANKAIANPNSFQVNTALQRCMTKAISMLGLGAYIYAGEDLPPTPKDKEITITSQEGDEVETKKASGADMIFKTFSTFMKSMDTVERLESFYQQNIEAVRVLQRLDTSQYESLLALFKKQKQDILKATAKQKEKA